MAARMLQGTGSDVGKSVLVAALCRALTHRGLRVRPFKPQNMSNNAAVTADGGEIGRAQALQAIACRAEPHSDMNPVLLKPQADRTSQLIVHGRVRGTLGSGNFREARGALMTEVLESYHRLRGQCDIVIVEGAGSPAEINLRKGDIANMGFARAADVPVVLIGDIDRGGVIASIVGTRAVIEPGDAAMIRGFLINKFRGDPALFDDGYREIERRSGWHGLGVIPWLSAAARLPSEDAVILERPADPRDGRRMIACPILPRISNFDDLDPLKLEPGVEVAMVPPGRPIPAEARGHGLLDVETTLSSAKCLRRVTGTALGAPVTGYEMHMGETVGPSTERPFAMLDDGASDGAASADGKVIGSYLHGLFASARLRDALLARIDVAGSGRDYVADVDAALDEIAAEFAAHADIGAMLRIAGIGG